MARKPLAVTTTAATTAPALKYATFYEALSKDPNHKMIMDAVAKDAATKAMLRLPLNVTAFVPTDTAFAKAAAKFGLGNNTSKLMANTCLLNALLKYHIMSPGMTQAKLATITSKNSMLVVSSTVNGAKKTTAKVLKFKVEGNNIRVQGGATSATLGKIRNVVAGKGILHNVDNVLLPSANLTTLAQMTGCKVTL